MKTRYMCILIDRGMVVSAVFFSALKEAAIWSRNKESFCVLKKFRNMYKTIPTSEDNIFWSIHSK